jgi:tetratricopeptide (TPR) repeat protein
MSERYHFALCRGLVLLLLLVVASASTAANGDVDGQEARLAEARALFEQRTAASLQASFELYRKAALEAPALARAHAGVASTACLLALYAVQPAGEVLPVAKTAAEEAVRLEPGLARAWAALGLVSYLHEWRWTDAERHFARSIDLDPLDATTYHWLGMMLNALGRFDEAVAAFDSAQRAAPDSAIVRVKRGTVLAQAGRLEEAERQLREASRRFPKMALAHRETGFLRLTQGRIEEAVVAFEEAVQLAGPRSSSAGGLGLAYARSGRHAETRAILESFLAGAEAGFTPPLQVALLYLALDDTDRSIEWLERAFESRDPGVVYLAVKPAYDGLRDDARFTSLLTRIGLR